MSIEETVSDDELLKWATSNKVHSITESTNEDETELVLTISFTGKRLSMSGTDHPNISYQDAVNTFFLLKLSERDAVEHNRAIAEQFRF